MKTMLPLFIFLILGVTLSTASAGAAGEAKQKHYGEKLQGLKAENIKDLLAMPEKYSKSNCAVEGVVEKICEKKGCWLTLQNKSEASSVIRMSFKDYGFFVGKDIIGKEVRAEGQVQVKQLSPEQIAHLKSDGADIQSKTDITFVASGLELLTFAPKK